VLLCFDVSCQVLRLRLAGTRNQQISRKNIWLGISTNHSREMLQFQPDTSAHQKVNIFIGQRSKLFLTRPMFLKNEKRERKISFL
jgi:hypothetical protein